MVAVVEFVEVGEEDGLFRVRHFEAACREDFVDFAAKGAAGGWGGNFDQLLGDGGGTGDRSTVAQAIKGRARQGEEIDTAVPEDAFVFGGERPIDPVLGDPRGEGGLG